MGGEHQGVFLRCGWEKWEDWRNGLKLRGPWNVHGPFVSQSPYEIASGLVSDWINLGTAMHSMVTHLFYWQVLFLWHYILRSMDIKCKSVSVLDNNALSQLDIKNGRDGYDNQKSSLPLHIIGKFSTEFPYPSTRAYQ